MNFDFTAFVHWDRIPGWFSLDKVIAMQLAVKQHPKALVVVELGSFQGRNSVPLAAVLPQGAKMYCVDHFQGSEEHHRAGLDLSKLRQVFQANLARFGVEERITVLAKKTTEAANEFVDDSVDLLFIDASHDYDSVKADLDSWYRKLKPEWLAFCDDYDPVRWPGVVKAISDFGLQGKTFVPHLWFYVANSASRLARGIHHA